MHTAGMCLELHAVKRYAVSAEGFCCRSTLYLHVCVNGTQKSLWGMPDVHTSHSDGSYGA